MSASGSDSALVLELAEEFLQRYRNGGRPSLKEYVECHPELVTEIRATFPAMALMEHIALADESLERPAASVAEAGPSLQQVGDYRILRSATRSRPGPPWPGGGPS